MKKISCFVSLIFSFLLLVIPLTACNDIPTTDVILPDENKELVVYEIPVDTNYSLLFQEKYNTFDIPIYTNKSLTLNDVKLLSTDLETQDVSVTVSNLKSVDISVDSNAIDFVENQIELKVSANGTSEDLSLVRINRLHFSLQDIEYFIDVKVAIYMCEISNTYPDTIFDIDSCCDVTNKNGEDRILLFAGNLAEDISLHGYYLLGGEWLSIVKSQWYGSRNALIYELGNEITVAKEISTNDFKSLFSYFTFSYSKTATQWYSDNICIKIVKTNGSGNETVYNLAYKVVNLISDNGMSAYYSNINEIIKNQI